MEYKLHKNFLKAYKKLTTKLQNITKEKLVIFNNNPFSEELNNHKLNGKYKEYYSINITGDYRAIYKKIGEKFVIFTIIGTHSELYK